MKVFEIEFGLLKVVISHYVWLVRPVPPVHTSIQALEGTA